MPDPMPEHREIPPQWPPLAGHDEPTTPPEPAGAPPETAGTPFNAGAMDAYADSMDARTAVPPQTGAPDEPPATDARLSDRLPESTPAPPRSSPPPPDTHGRGVRMTIYGFGGAVVVALIVVIVVMAGGGLSSIGEDDGDNADRLISDSGEVDEKQYTQLAESVGTDEWIQWRYGPSAGSGGDRPKAKQPDTSQVQIPGSDIKHPYQHGNGSSAADPRNVQGQLGYVPDDSGASVDHVTTMETTASTVGFTPRAGGRFSADAQDPDVSSKALSDCVKDGELGNLAAADRSNGKGPRAHAVLAYSSGVIATSGISGAQDGACLKLPKGQVPTSVAVTPANEFALVSVWDTEKVRGRVAVVALGDTPGTYAASWPQTHPGLPNPGHFSFAKLLGFVELTGTKAPTSIAAGTDYNGGDVNRVAADMSTEQGRASYEENAAKSGYAVVASSAERKLEWIDLEPLLSGYHDAYFMEDPQTYESLGQDAQQWPPTFESDNQFVPEVSKVTELDDAPQSVASIDGAAFVADRSGKVLEYTADDPAAPDSTGSLNLGHAATCLSPTADGKKVLATSREDRSVSWIDPSKDDPSVSRTLHDKRIVDPICAVDNHDTATADGTGTRAQTVSIADYGGGALHTFSYGSATMSNGKDVSLKHDEYEYGGAYEPKGKPFVVTTTVDNF